MSHAKILLSAVLAVFCFAAGIFFQSRLVENEGGRELASVRAGNTRQPSNAKVDPKVSAALRACVAEKVNNNSLELSKVVVDGRNWAIVSIDCVGDKAKALYESVAGYSSEQYVRYSDGRRGVARFFGRLYPPSQCVRVIRASRGSELNLYSCSVRLDLDHELIEGLKL